ncbi:SRPBCC family protein [Nocardioides terrisoli]|uniref:SRPBCC family protein n=1 Tax=Nocardioides terrisoli TaxID=3388267 RepID=UPI00287B60EA|nr:SRPBCC family protein [Nocardioides marmorisolisilvae]
MPITSIHKDPEALTLTVVADFAAPLQRLWDAYADPRQLERFWGPPSYPATFTRHDMLPGGRSAYAMVGPEGEVSRGYWEFLDVKAPYSFEVRDGFCHPDGTPNTEMPSMRMVFSFEATGSGSRVTTTTYFNTVEELAQLVEMGMEEGMRQAMGQIDGVLEDLRSFAADLPAAAQVLSDTTVRVSRVIRGSVEQVWSAHHDPTLLTQWLLGPDGWSMPTCEVASEVGQVYRYVWQQDDGGTSFGSTGELLEVSAPHRAVTTERMYGDGIPEDAPSTVNELTLTPVDGGTLLSLLITYPDATTRDIVLGTGMVDGMETSYARLEGVLAG